MFKFLKSKKGFTLVELMIVVVIMAILVAVAVPIYSAVTDNARKKTCAGNQREIVSQITNNVMSNPSYLKLTTSGAKGTFTIETNTAGDGLANTANYSDVLTIAFTDLFNANNLPFCPEKGAKITVEVTCGADAGSCVVKTSCDKHNAA